MTLHIARFVVDSDHKQETWHVTLRDREDSLNGRAAVASLPPSSSLVGNSQLSMLGKSTNARGILLWLNIAQGA